MHPRVGVLRVVSAGSRVHQLLGVHERGSAGERLSARMLLRLLALRRSSRFDDVLELCLRILTKIQLWNVAREPILTRFWNVHVQRELRFYSLIANRMMLSVAECLKLRFFVVLLRQGRFKNASI